MEFLIETILQLHFGPGIDSSCNRNECKEYFLRGKGGRCIGLATLPTSNATCDESWVPEPPRNLIACRGIALSFNTY
jgi:hypothetical protein